MIISITNLIPLIDNYMFSSENMKIGYDNTNTSPHKTSHKTYSNKQHNSNFLPENTIENTTENNTKNTIEYNTKNTIENKPYKTNKYESFIPFQKDKLFWCFYIILKGYDEYEMNRSTFFTIEKQIKIEAVEKLKTIKDKLKELKLKRTDLEDELVNKQVITTKGLYALCLIHNVSITYIYGRKYCELFSSENGKQGIIVKNDKNEDTLRWSSNENNDNKDSIDEYIKKIQDEYWLIENIQKPLNAPSSYSSNDLHVITIVNDKIKSKTKKQLYEEILEHL